MRQRAKAAAVGAVHVASLLALAGGLLGCPGQARRTTANPPGPASAAGAIGKFHAEFTAQPSLVKAGEPTELIFQIKDPSGRDVRFLQFVHERPLHLLIVSEDLGDFAHVHPEQLVGTTYNVTHIFSHGGEYRLYADYTPPGSGKIVEQFSVHVDGKTRPAERLQADTFFTKNVGGIRVTLSFDRPPRAGDDVQLTCALADASTGLPLTDLQLYLGALAHFVVISEDKTSFIHAHPLEAGEVYDPSQDPSAHFHTLRELDKRLIGPSPSEVRAITTFPRRGRYKLWAQFQRNDQSITVPFVLDVAAGEKPSGGKRPVIPVDAIKVVVGATGYVPAQLQLQQGRPVTLAFYRPDGNNCGGTVLFPSLNLKYALPVGQTVLVEFTPKEPGEIPFTCAMGMLKGVLTVK